MGTSPLQIMEVDDATEKVKAYARKFVSQIADLNSKYSKPNLSKVEERTLAKAGNFSLVEPEKFQPSFEVVLFWYLASKVVIVPKESEETE